MRRWTIVVYAIALGLLCVTLAWGGQWWFAGAAAGMACLMFVSEFVLRSRMTLAPSRWCSNCGARSAESALKCVECGREYVSGKPVLYAPDLQIIPATRRPAKIIAWVLVPIVVLAFAAAFVFQINISYSYIIYLFCIYYGYEFLNWVLLRRLAAHVLAHEGAVCPSCTYPLDETMQKCPECGEAGTALAAQRLWRQSGLWLGAPKAFTAGSSAPASKGGTA